MSTPLPPEADDSWPMPGRPRPGSQNDRWAPQVTVLIAGGTVYVYDPHDGSIDSMHMMLDALDPAQNVLRRTMPVGHWTAGRRQLGSDIKIIDMRADRAKPAGIP